MKKFYYFSEKNLKFIEIKDFKVKVGLFLFLTVFLLSSAIFGGYFLFSDYLSPDKELASLRLENKALKSKLLEISTDYSVMQDELEELSKLSDDLRLAVNLKPLSQDEKLLGIGGSANVLSLDFLQLGKNIELTDALNFVENISRKFEFEKTQYEEITNQLTENKKLFAAIPAILPTTGSYTSDSFGMRLHPILNKYKMHNGLDINTNIGTPVYAPGNGKVTFIGRRAGYGLLLEIDHGFGYTTLYAHLSKVSVKEGKQVKRGDLIAKTGNSGLSSGPHLHYEVIHKGVPQDPIDFFFEDFNFFDAKN
ncbi:MAG TPA: M23 family metallopeptidase [Ignavibacteriaceae bacterium]|nr:M23 family metallopeptidase [Ignavibacteriaceae bacterium]